MQEIIVAMDFSKCALNALSYAITIANAINANITIVWVDKPGSSDSIFDNSLGTHRKEVHRRFEEILKKYSKDLTNGGSLKYKIRTGKVYEEINNQAKYSDAKYIVAGTHGISGFEEFWIGSNANRIVASAPCPVFTVRQGFVVQDKISKILLPIDSTNETRQKAPYVLELAKAFNAEVLILGLMISNVTAIKNRIESYCKQMVKYYTENKVKNSLEYVKATNVTSATISYAEEKKVDLIAIMTEQESAAANIFLGPFAQQMVNHSPIPVLSVHPKNFYTYIIQ